MKSESNTIKASKASIVGHAAIVAFCLPIWCSFLFTPLRLSILAGNWGAALLSFMLVYPFVGSLFLFQSLMQTVILNPNGVTITTPLRGTRFLAFSDITSAVLTSTICGERLTLTASNGKRLRLHRLFLPLDKWNHLRSFISERVPLRWMPR